jgi:hypothetical protein
MPTNGAMPTAGDDQPQPSDGWNHTEVPEIPIKDGHAVNRGREAQLGDSQQREVLTHGSCLMVAACNVQMGR